MGSTWENLAIQLGLKGLMFEELFRRLLGEGLKNDASLKALMGESRAKQQQRLKERLEKLKQMKQEGKEVDERQLDKLEKLDAEGLESVDQSTLEMIAQEIIAEEAEGATTKSLLHDLQV